jgi:hypothetical protein
MQPRPGTPTVLTTEESIFGQKNGSFPFPPRSIYPIRRTPMLHDSSGGLNAGLRTDSYLAGE